MMIADDLDRPSDISRDREPGAIAARRETLDRGSRSTGNFKMGAERLELSRDYKSQRILSP